MFNDIKFNVISGEKLCELGFVYAQHLNKWIFSRALNSAIEFTIIIDSDFSDYTISVFDCDMSINLNIEEYPKLKTKVNKFMKKFKEFGLLDY